MTIPKSKRYFDCIQIMQYLAKDGFTQQCNKQALTTAIMIMKGGDPRTIKSWTDSLRIFKMISFHRHTKSVFNLHFDRVPEALTDLVKRGQKRLY